MFIPYWDFSHANNSIPVWVKNFKPKGIQAIAPAGLPPGHPGHGKEGHTYQVQVTRWPGTNPAVPYSPSAGLVGRVLRETDYTRFTRGLEWAPGLVRPASAAEIDRTGMLISRLGQAAKEFTPLVESLRAGAVNEQLQFPVLRALYHLESTLAVPSILPGADRGTMKQLLGTVTKFFQTGPHTDVHTWVAGHHPLKPAVRGTAVYFHETVADPLFVMLHAEVDRIWATWQMKNSGRPDLRGADATFKPWEGGRTWTLPELLDYQSLSYRYDRMYMS